MKKLSTTLFANISRDEVLKLTTTVAETLDFNAAPLQKKLFTAADLWSIQRQKKSISRRYSF